jgi:hypothetical protein
MKIVEAIVIEQESGLFSQLIAELPFSSLENQDFPCYRLQVDPSLVMLFYLFRDNHRIPGDWLNHSAHHIKRIILLTSREKVEEWQLEDVVKEELLSLVANIPKFLLLVSPNGSEKDLSRDTLEKFGKPVQVVHWNNNDRDMARQIWKMIWSKSSSRE